MDPHPLRSTAGRHHDGGHPGFIVGGLSVGGGAAARKVSRCAATHFLDGLPEVLKDMKPISPGLRRGTRTLFRAGSNYGESLRCPAVVTMDVSSWRCSTARCGQVRPGGLAAARASEPVVVRPDGDAAGRLLLQLPPFPGPGGVPKGPADRGVDVDGPGDQFCRVGPGLELGEDPTPAPSRCHQRNRSHSRPHAPCSAGRARRGTPVRTRNRMPSISCRLAHVGGRTGWRGVRGSRSRSGLVEMSRPPVYRKGRRTEAGPLRPCFDPWKRDQASRDVGA